MTRLVLLSCAFLAACGGSKIQPDQQYDLTGGNLDFSHTGDGPGMTSNPDLIGADLIGANADLATVTNPPVIVVTAPATGMEVVGNNLTIAATVTSPVKRAIASVIVSVPGQTTSTTLTNTNGSDSYTAMRDITGTGASGTFVITATDTAGGVAMQQVTYDHDGGPIITFIQPVPPMGQSTIYAAGQIAVDVTVSSPNSKYTITTVTGAVGEGPFTLNLVSGSSPAEYDGSIVFSSYKQPLTGKQQIVITATNSNNTTTTASQDFTVDETGPVIDITSPVQGQFYGGLIDVTALITDESGINNSTVIAVFGGDASNNITLTPDPNTAGLYVGQFSLAKLSGTFVTPDISVSASDSLGNKSTESYQIEIDTTPPILSLDTPSIRGATLQSGVWVCSVPFDPLGDDAVNDKSDPSKLAQLITLRARVEDRGNKASGQEVVAFSGIDPTSVILYAVPVASKTADVPVAVDTDGDGICDSINPTLTPVQGTGQATSSEYVSLTMVAMPSIGQLNFADTSGATVAGCDAVGQPGAIAPSPLCNAALTDYTYALQYGDPSGPAIWTIPEALANDTECTGHQFDTQNLPEGGVCIVAVATDKTGNHSVSAPLRTCIRRTSQTNHPCDTWSSSIPTCTGTYSPTPMTSSLSPSCTSTAFSDTVDYEY